MNLRRFDPWRWLLRPGTVAALTLAGAAWAWTSTIGKDLLAAKALPVRATFGEHPSIPMAKVVPLPVIPAARPAAPAASSVPGRSDFPPLTAEASLAWGVRFPVVAEAASAPPAAPPPPLFPYKFIGLIADVSDAAPASAASSPSIQQAILWTGQQTVLVRAGDSVEQAWRIDSVSARALTVTHLPTNTASSVLENNP